MCTKTFTDQAEVKFMYIQSYNSRDYGSKEGRKKEMRERGKKLVKELAGTQ